jgi:hypothetical protein
MSPRSRIFLWLVLAGLSWAIILGVARCTAALL